MAALTQTRRDPERDFFHGRGFHRITVATSLCEAQRARAWHRRLGGNASTYGALFCFRKEWMMKSRTRIGVPNMKIEKQKIDNMAIKQPIGQITQNASKQQCQRKIAPRIRLP